MRATLVAGCLAAAVTATGCLVKETTHTIHLSPDGTVSWTVIERAVRSDEPDGERRHREEDEYLTAARLGRHPVAAAFGLLAPAGIQTTIHRDRRPFLVLTEARFDRLDWLAGRLLDRLKLSGTSTLERVNDGWRWTLKVDKEAEAEESDEAGLLSALAEDVSAYCVVLESGRFIDAVGFELSGDGAAARPVDLEDRTADGPFVLSLTWTGTAR